MTHGPTLAGILSLLGALSLGGCPAAIGEPVDELRWEIVDGYGSLIRVRWEQLEAATVHAEFTFEDDRWEASPAQALEAGPGEVLLLGVPFDTDVRARLVVDDGADGWTSAELDARTDPPPPGLPEPTLTVADDGAGDPALRYLLGSIDDGVTALFNPFWTFIVDRDGRVVWARESPPNRATLHPRLSHDGRELLIDHNTFWALFDNGSNSQVVRLTIDGTEHETIDTPGLHHPFTELADGSLVWGATDGLSETLEERSADGERRTIWDCAPFHDAVGADQYCASNTLFWHEPSDRLLFSFYSTHSILEIDHASGEVVRYFGQLDGAWAFADEADTFWWQHGVHYTDDGTLLLSAHAAGDSDECVVREYTLDEDAETLEQVWSYGVGNGVDAPVMGEAHRLPGGHTLHNYGSGNRVREVTADGELLWELLWEVGDNLGRTTPLDDLYALAP